ncbi:response regulator [Roseospirillum parvum]|uniref:response regulator n=1 Tax=Roseospirillum parvum TaxID=83401 RepID=UPI000B8953AE|nr:response regulator transcription factor [Roseospirillum parvum]
MRILIADDHELFRDGLRLVLAGLEEDLTIVEAASYEEALDQIGQGPPLDLVLLDLIMPDMHWSEGLAALKARLGEVPVVILSASEDRNLVVETVQQGAAGFIPKTSSSKVMIGALKLVISGGIYLPPALVGDPPPVPTPGGTAPPANRMPEAAPAAPPRPVIPEPPAEDSVPAHLTPRQRQVLALLGQGKSNKEIARALNLSEGTVKLHVTAILKALKVSNRTGAVVAAARLGLGEASP